MLYSVPNTNSAFKMYNILNFCESWGLEITFLMNFLANETVYSHDKSCFTDFRE